MKPRLIILSDLWGKQKSDWVRHYINELEDQFNIQFYDCCELGSIDISDYTQDALHSQFVNGGIARATQKVIELEQEPVQVLAFSIGGSIAWNYALQTEKVNRLFCLSSTRLRHETEKPDTAIKLWYGALDTFRPSEAWSTNMKMGFEILFDKGHEMYQETEVIKKIAQYICKAKV